MYWRRSMVLEGYLFNAYTRRLIDILCTHLYYLSQTEGYHMDCTHTLSVKMTDESFQKLRQLARQHHCSLSDMVIQGLALMQVALEAEAEQQSLVVVTKGGEATKRIVLPSTKTATCPA